MWIGAGAGESLQPLRRPLRKRSPYTFRKQSECPTSGSEKFQKRSTRETAAIGLL